MWVDILSANPGPVADILAEVANDLDAAVRALRELDSADEAKRAQGAAGVGELLRRGNAGRARVPGKHGQAPAVYETVTVLISDRPGQLARIFADAGSVGVNIEDVRIEHATGQQAGRMQLMVEPGAVPVLEQVLRERGWSLRQ
jgi:prephenate dehydrogenase